MPLASARGRILREDASAPEDLPAFDRSAMDGYAIDASDVSERFRVVLEVQPGPGPRAEKLAAASARVFLTGAQSPEGASQVIMQEDVVCEGEWITVRERDVQAWDSPARRGCAAPGELLLAAGARLRSGRNFRLLAQIGATQLRVGRAPRVLHFATGNELVDPSAVPGAGQIRDSNSTLIGALLAEDGGGVDRARPLRGRPRCARARDSKASAGGVGRSAHFRRRECGRLRFRETRVEAEIGFTVHFRQMNIRPGKPLVFATRGSQVAFVIPGNPVSHFVTFQVAIRHALERLEGAPVFWARTTIELAADLPAKPNERETLWPAHVAASDGNLRASPLAWQSSGDLRGLLGVNALLPIAPGAGAARKGDHVDCILLGSIA